MIEAIKFWNEPNNLSHWDFEMDPEWKEYTRMTMLAAQAVRSLSPELTLVLGGISPIDPKFIDLLKRYGLLEYVDAVAVHGFPLDWNHWRIHDWPDKISEIEEVANLPVWITEVGASSFGAEEVQVFGIERTTQLLSDRLERVYWYSLLDLPPTWDATTRHKESEGSSYYRHFYMGLIRSDNTPKPAFQQFNPEMGICQWIHFQDPRFDSIIHWLRKLNVKKLRTGISWADWLRPHALDWFDRQMEALREFDTTITLCFTPESKGKRPHHTSPPVDPHEFADFAVQVVRRYVHSESGYSQERPIFTAVGAKK
ncbi:glycosyl hydrolase [Desulfomonile tiedjei]|uniref:Glycosyl hydrolase catalytic core n=1 Tax=Desulfomonile tiedjei (strain ATCC 49306 / DSM 6799 / DCB-1) TaxID=706587 RepID=I4C679_DESTA|nr:glycosyl hydrolase [Desulfomonile tiedjei]AFM25070.1 Glycosyl hydrolase catalytic core [Desulfomonile tiedjei DSM 6799]